MPAYRLRQMQDSLTLDGLQANGFQMPEPLGWLEQSWTDPRGFFSGLLSTARATLGVSLKSASFSHYDFYYDIFESRKNSGETAFIHYDVNGRRQAATYGDLKRLTDHCAGEWQARGVGEGACLCLVYPLGLEFAVGLLAALKLGLIVSFVSPDRPYLMKQQLAALSPDYIATSPVYAALAGDFRDRLVHTLPAKKSPGEPAPRPRVYQTGQTAARLFDVSLEAGFVPVEVPCDALYLNAFRDGVLALNLGPGELLSAPGWSAALTQPFMLLSVFLSGAAFLDLKPDLCAKTPAMLESDPPTVLGMNREFRTFLASVSRDLFARCRFWFRPPADSGDAGAWQGFITVKGLDKRLTGVIQWHAQAGGILAFSRRRKGLVMETLLPSAGMKWRLAPLPDGGMLPSPDFGRMAVCVGEAERITPYLFVKNGVEWLCPSSYLNEKQGRFYPRELVQAFIRELNFNRPFIIVPVNRPASPRQTYDLVVFSGAGSNVDKPGLSKKLSDRITRYLGREYCPDRIVFLPVLPRLAEDGVMDTERCMTEYAANRLSKRAGHPVFRDISRFKEMMLIQKKLSISAT